MSAPTIKIDLSKIPAATAPPGYVSNLEHPDRTLETVVMAVNVIMMALTIIVVLTPPQITVDSPDKEIPPT